MEWIVYETNFRQQAQKENISQVRINNFLEYAKKLFDQNLPIIYDVEHLSRLLGFELQYVMKISNASYCMYRQYWIPKKNADEQREILEPYNSLKEIQQWILKNILYKIAISPFAKAYTPHLGIKDNARFHKGKQQVVKLDIKNFFPSISFKMVKDIFVNVGYKEQLAIALGNLCMYRNRLPQGAITSPYLSNIIFLPCDQIIAGFCKSRKIAYTRYADDMTFSGEINISELISFVKKTVFNKLGMKLNTSKTRILPRNRRQIVTGVIVNKTIQAPKEYRKKIRQEVYYIKRFGLYDHIKQLGIDKTNYLGHLLGKVNYALYLNPKDQKLREYHDYLVRINKEIQS